MINAYNMNTMQRAVHFSSQIQLPPPRIQPMRQIEYSSGRGLDSLPVRAPPLVQPYDTRASGPSRLR